MRTSVYSWRLDPERKAALEEAARREGTTVSELLDRATDALLRASDSANDEAYQTELHEKLQKSIGALAQGRGGHAARVREVVRRRGGRGR